VLPRMKAGGYVLTGFFCALVGSLCWLLFVPIRELAGSTHAVLLLSEETLAHPRTYELHREDSEPMIVCTREG